VPHFPTASLALSPAKKAQQEEIKDRKKKKRRLRAEEKEIHEKS
jgi:hypothetical protein